MYNLLNLIPYGDTLNDGKLMLSFTLPIKNDEKGAESAKLLVKKMGLSDPSIAIAKTLDNDFTHYIIYAVCTDGINYNQVVATPVEIDLLTIEQTNEYIKQNFNKKLVVIGASTGTDAHTVGIDAIMNRKGFAGHYGLERYDMLECFNLGSQVPNEEFVKKAKEVNADIMLVSQTVTQKDIHIKNLTELIELAEVHGVRKNALLICGGSKITNELAQELGFDAGFGTNKFADDVISYAVKELNKRNHKEQV